MLILTPIILLLGIVTSYTDIKFKKIKNKHLFFAIALSVIAYAYLIFTQQITINWNLPLNILIGISIGLILYFTDSWGGGDAKLFIVFCLLMPTEKYNSTLFFPSIAIFVNIFLLSALTILILSFKKIIKDRKEISKKTFSLNTAHKFGESFAIIFCLKWLIESIIDYIIPQTTFQWTIIVLFISYRIVKRLIRKIKNQIILFLMLGLGLVARLLMHSLDDNITELIFDLKTTAFYTFIIHGISLIFDSKASDGGEKETIPFAPLMLTGTLLTQTNLLNGTINLINTINK